MENELEEGTTLQIDFQKLQKIGESGLEVIPAVAWEKNTGQVLMLGFVNKAALEHSIQNSVATFWSTSRNEIWVKGATSGEFLDILDIRINCEQNSILYVVKLRSSGACHTMTPEGKHRYSCYYRSIQNGELRFT